MQEPLPILDSENPLEAYADRLWESVETHQLAENALVAISDLVVDVSKDGEILGANAAFCRLIGIDNSQVTGRYCRDFELLRDLQKPRQTLQIATSSGDEIWIDRTQLSMRDPKTGLAFIRVVGRDVTEHKNSEHALIEARQAAETADAAKTRFLAMISHEIRTPLNGIIGMGKLLSDTSLSLEQQNYVEAITTSGEALLLLVNDLLQFGRQELTEHKTVSEPTAIAPLVAGVMELMAEKAYAKGLDFGYKLHRDLPENVTLDAGRLRQILFNVIGNAVKFTDEGGIRVDLRLAKSGMLAVFVEDTGPGIPPEKQDSIFDPFEQIESTLTRTHDGAGLGLAIARKLAIAMGGDIKLQSDGDSGSNFSISIRVQDADKFKNHAKPMRGQEIVLCMKPGVEADILREIIEDQGGLVTSVESMSSALEATTQRCGIHQIVLDHRCAQEFKIETENPFPKNCKLIALIEPGQRGKTGAIFKAAGHSFLTRPLRPSTVVRVLTDEVFQPDIRTEPLPKAVTPSKHLKVLLAEDNAVNALLATKLLERQGCNVHVVENGLEAVNAITPDHNYDLILMDLHMPVMDGLTAIKAIRQNEEDRGDRSTPIMMTTADTQVEMQEQVMAAGATSLLDKPLNLDQLQSALRMQSENAA